MQENFYIKKLYYGQYVKNVVLPMSLTIGNQRNEKGINNIGNITKLRNNTIRTRNALIHKTFHEFSTAKCRLPVWRSKRKDVCETKEIE